MGGSGAEQEVECSGEEVKRKWMKWGGSRGEIKRKWGGSEGEMGRKSTCCGFQREAVALEGGGVKQKRPWQLVNGAN